MQALLELRILLKTKTTKQNAIYTISNFQNAFSVLKSPNFAVCVFSNWMFVSEHVCVIQFIPSYKPYIGLG